MLWKVHPLGVPFLTFGLPLWYYSKLQLIPKLDRAGEPKVMLWQRINENQWEIGPCQNHSNQKPWPQPVQCLEEHLPGRRHHEDCMVSRCTICTLAVRDGVLVWFVEIPKWSKWFVWSRSQRWLDDNAGDLTANNYISRYECTSAFFHQHHGEGLMAMRFQ